ncbi:MAG: hypothetical protein AB3N24_19535 [Leisingera sp.]
MSDPVTHAEIEDVLSSIRRLVSEDSRGQPAAPEPAARLVLTPALRVQEPEGPEAAAPEEAPEPAAATQPDKPSPSESAPAESKPEPAPAEAEPDDEKELPEPPSVETWETEDSSSAAEAFADEPPIAFRHRGAPETADAGSPEEADSDGSHSEAVPDAGAETASADAPWADPRATLFAAADAAGLAGTPASPDSQDTASQDQASGTAGARAASVVRKIAELEARSAGAEGQEQQHWEPDSQTEAPFAGSGTDTIEWRDEPLSARQSSSREEADDAEEPEGFTGGAAEPGTGQPAGSASAETVAEAAITGAAMESLAEAGDTYLDEDSLRDLVASIVREELQGPLGERITRNVRKLVRREIHRALAAHDLL